MREYEVNIYKDLREMRNADYCGNGDHFATLEEAISHAKHIVKNEYPAAATIHTLEFAAKFDCYDETYQRVVGWWNNKMVVAKQGSKLYGKMFNIK